MEEPSIVAAAFLVGSQVMELGRKEDEKKKKKKKKKTTTSSFYM